MDFEPTDDQVALQGELRRFLADRVTPEARRAILELPVAVDRDLWRELGALGTFSHTYAGSTIDYTRIGNIAAVAGGMSFAWTCVNVDNAVMPTPTFIRTRARRFAATMASMTR